MSWYNKIKNTPLLNKIIALNVMVFIVANVVLLVNNSSDQLITSKLSWSATALIPNLFFRPWTWFTHLFFHIEFWHLISNMIILYFGGTYFTQSIGKKKLLPVYLLGGLTGYCFYVFSFHFFPSLNIAANSLGASAAVIAILVAAATYRPKTIIRLFGTFEVQFWIIALTLVLYDFASLNTYENSGGHIAHLGGALFGLLFAVQYKKGINMAQWLVNLIEKIRILFDGKNKNTQRSFYDKPYVSDEEYNVRKLNNQKRIDQLLDKISKSGYSSLTTREKEFLNQHSNK